MKPQIDYHKNFVQCKKREATEFIAVHCAATQNKPEYTWKTIDAMHRQNGWLCIGYHFVILTDGTIQNGRDIDAIGSHVAGYNYKSIGVCLIGGVDKNGKAVDNFTPEQKASLRQLLVWLKSEYPDAVIQGHRDFPNVNKECPCFDVKSWFAGELQSYHTVVEGDTLWRIGRTYGLSIASLMLLNPSIKEADALSIGQKVLVRK